MERIEFEKERDYIEKVKGINTNKNLKYNIFTMGCMLNENDSEKICGIVEEMGYTKCDNPKLADLTLAVFAKMQRKSYLENLENLKTTKKKKVQLS